jgi:hypothetical protein
LKVRIPYRDGCKTVIDINEALELLEKGYVLIGADEKYGQEYFYMQKAKVMKRKLKKKTNPTL